METAAAATIVAVDLEEDAILVLYCCYDFAEAKGEFSKIVETCHQRTSLYSTVL